MKSLLVAAALCVGTSAWADGNKRTLNSQNYENATVSDWSGGDHNDLKTGDAVYGNYSQSWINSGTSGNRGTVKPITYEYTPDAYTTAAMDVAGYNVEFDVLLVSGSVNARSNSQFIVATSAISGNSAYTGSDYIFALSQPTRDASGTSTSWYVNDLSHEGSTITLSGSVWYHVKLVITSTSVVYTITSNDDSSVIATGSKTITSLPTINCFYSLIGRGSGKMNFDNLDIYDYTATLTANAPTLTLKAVSGANRIYELANTNVGGTLYYTTAPAAEAPAVGNAAYSSTTDASKDITFSEAGKYYAYAVLSDGTTTSTISEVEVTVGAITLPTPTYAITGLDAGYAKTFTITAANNVLLTPTVSLSYVFTPEGGAAQSPVNMAGNTISATAAGTYVVTSSAAGYTSASVTIKNTTAYKLVKTIDFTALTASDFSELWKSATGGLRDYWTKRAAAIPADATYYTLVDPSAATATTSLSDVTFGNPGVRQPQVYIGYGLYTPYDPVSGSGNYLNLTINDATAEQLAVYQGWNNYGSGTFTTVQVGNANFGLYRYDTMLKTIKLYSPITEEFEVVSVSDAGYATFCPSKNIDFSAADDIEACTAAVDAEGKITYTVVSTVAAGEGVLLRTKSGNAANENLLVLDDAVANAGNAFVGIPAKTKLAQSTEAGYTNYILSKVDGVLGFYKVNDNGSWCNAGTAYLKVADSVTPVRGFFALWDEETTGISAVESKAIEGQVYNLKGQRVAQPTKGLYIVNGKKVILK